MSSEIFGVLLQDALASGGRAACINAALLMKALVLPAEPKVLQCRLGNMEILPLIETYGCS